LFQASHAACFGEAPFPGVQPGSSGGGRNPREWSQNSGCGTPVRPSRGVSISKAETLVPTLSAVRMESTAGRLLAHGVDNTSRKEENWAA
jgi:hypothetical protein